MKNSLLSAVALVVLVYLSTVLPCQAQSTYLSDIQAHQDKLTQDYTDEKSSILKDGKRERFIELGGHPFFEIDSAYRIVADLEVYNNPEKIGVPTSSEMIKDFLIYGKATFDLHGEKRSLTILQNVKMMSHPLYKDYLFVAYKDLNSGELTYGGGKYIDVKIPEDKSKLVIDFNKAYQPYCAYTDGYNCPVPPAENFLDMYVDAGVKHIDLDQLSAEELLGKSIAYHDPGSNWDMLSATFDFKTVMADSSERERTVIIDNADQTFHFSGRYQEGKLEYLVENSESRALWNGKESVPDHIAEKYRIAPERAVMYRNYYTYLYGMPMKLNDPGTNIHSKVERVKFHDKIYDKIKVTYDPEVGTDTWYFYFNPDTYALEAYQFFKDESKNDGEYILFEELKEVNGIKIPRIRHWYYNYDEKFLATDVLE